MTYFCGGTAFREKEGKPQLLAIRFQEENDEYPRIKLPGGMTKPGESWVKAFIREMDEEVAGLGFHITEFEKRWSEQVSHDHTKHFFVFNFEGSLRKEKKIDGNTILMPPDFYPIPFLYENIILSHKDALIDIITSQARLDYEVGWIVERLGLSKAS